MAFTVTHNFITLYDMESLTGWTGPASLVLNTDINRQGSACIGWLADTANTPVWGPAFTARDLSSTGGTRAILFWVNVLDYYDLDYGYAGGIQLLLEDSAGNQAYWYVGGKPSEPLQSRKYYGGWSMTGVSTGQAPNGYYTGTSIDLTQIVRIGFIVKKTAVSTSLTQDAFVDWCFLDSDLDGGLLGATVYGLNNTDGDALIELHDALEAADIGYIDRRGDGFIQLGPINIGTTDGVNPTRFISRGKSLVARTAGVLYAFPRLRLYGAAGSETTVEFGELVGVSPDVRGINGGFISAASPYGFNIGSNVTCNWYGLSFVNLNGWGDSNLNRTTFSMRDCSVNIVGSFLNGNDPVLENCIFYDGTEASFGAIRYNSTFGNLKNCEFINCQGALGFQVAGTYTLDNIKFTGNTYDIVNRSGGDVILQCINGSNPDPAKVNNTAGGSVTIINSVQITIRVIDLDNNNAPVPLAQTSIYDSSKTELLNTDTDSSGLATTTYNYQGSDVSVIVKVRKSSPGDVRYKNFSTNATITSTGLDLTVGMRRDTTVDPNI